MPLLQINKNIMSFSLWNNFLGNKTVSDFIPQFNVTEAFKDIRGLNYKGLVKQSVLNNGSYLKGVNTLKSMKDLKFYEELFQDRKSGNISNYSKTIKDFPDKHMLKNSMNDCNFYYSIEGEYYNPRLKRMIDVLPFNETEPLMSYHYYYMRELLGFQNITGMNNSEIRPHSLLWQAYKRGKDSLHASLQDKLCQFDRISHTISRKVTQCLVHVVTCQSHDGVRYVYGNIFALVKLGFYTTVWYNYTECAPDLFPLEMVPDNFADLFFKDGSEVPGYSKFVLLETKDDITQSVVEAFEEKPFNLRNGWIVCSD